MATKTAPAERAWRAGLERLRWTTLVAVSVDELALETWRLILALGWPRAARAVGLVELDQPLDRVVQRLRLLAAHQVGHVLVDAQQKGVDVRRSVDAGFLPDLRERLGVLVVRLHRRVFARKQLGYDRVARLEGAACQACPPCPATGRARNTCRRLANRPLVRRSRATACSNKVHHVRGAITNGSKADTHKYLGNNRGRDVLGVAGVAGTAAAAASDAPVVVVTVVAGPCADATTRANTSSKSCCWRRSIAAAFSSCRASMAATIACCRASIAAIASSTTRSTRRLPMVLSGSG